MIAHSFISVPCEGLSHYYRLPRQFSCKCFLKDGLAEAGGALEVGGHHRFQLLHHA